MTVPAAQVSQERVGWGYLGYLLPEQVELCGWWGCDPGDGAASHSSSFALRRPSWALCWVSVKEWDVLIKVGLQMKLGWWGVLRSAFSLRHYVCSAGFLQLTCFKVSSLVWAMLSLMQTWSFICIFRIMNVCCIHFPFLELFFLCIRILSLYFKSFNKCRSWSVVRISLNIFTVLALKMQNTIQVLRLNMSCEESAADWIFRGTVLDNAEFVISR